MAFLLPHCCAMVVIFVSAVWLHHVQGATADNEALPDVLDLTDYIKWTDMLPESQRQATFLPDEIKDKLLFTQMKMVPGFGSFRRSSRFVRSETKLRFTLSYHVSWDGTFILEFAPTENIYDSCVDVTYGYRTAQISDDYHIRIHKGIYDALTNSEFAARFDKEIISMMEVIRTQWHDAAIKQLLIQGHSMGGAISQAFYLLLQADERHAIQAVKALKQLPKMKLVMKEFDRRVTVITTGAFQILPHHDNFITNPKPPTPRIFTNRIYNLIKRRDPVPMIFGGAHQIEKADESKESCNFPNVRTSTAKERITWSASEMQTAIRALHKNKKLGTATTVGKFYVVSKREGTANKLQRNFHRVKGAVKGSFTMHDPRPIGIDIRQLRDGGYNHYTHYTRHLKEGNSLLQSAVGVLDEVGFGLRAAFNHIDQDYYSDIVSFILNDPYYANGDYKYTPAVDELRHLMEKKHGGSTSAASMDMFGVDAIQISDGIEFDNGEESARIAREIDASEQSTSSYSAFYAFAIICTCVLQLLLCMISTCCGAVAGYFWKKFEIVATTKPYADVTPDVV